MNNHEQIAGADNSEAWNIQAPEAEQPAEQPAEQQAEQPAGQPAEQQAKQPKEPIDVDVSKISDNPPEEAVSIRDKKYSDFLPDGSAFFGTPEEYQKELQDYRDRAGA